MSAAAGLFVEEHGEILQRFLAREQIFATDWFRESTQLQARQYLEASVEAETIVHMTSD